MCLKYEKFEWKVYAKSKIKKVIDETVKPTVVNLLGLSASKCWLQEVVIFLKVFKKIFIRFKTCKLTRLMKQLRQQLNKFINCDLWRTMQMKPFVEEQFDVKTGYILLPTSQSLKVFDSQLAECSQILEKILHCALWLTLGHNLHHYCTALATISRIKAFKVYISDLRDAFRMMSKMSDSSNTDLITDTSNVSMMTECGYDLLTDLSSPLSQKCESKEQPSKLNELPSEALPQESVMVKDILENEEKSVHCGKEKLKRITKRKLMPKKEADKMYKYVSSLKVLKLKY